METDENGRRGRQKSPFVPREDPGCEPIFTFMHTELVQSHGFTISWPDRLPLLRAVAFSFFPFFYPVIRVPCPMVHDDDETLTQHNSRIMKRIDANVSLPCS